MSTGAMTTTKVYRATWAGREVARSDRTIEAHGYRYFPRDSVRMEHLRVSPKTDDDLECPHGVQFYDLVNGTDASPRAAWSYEAPKPSMKHVDHWVGFWDDVVVD